MPEPVKTRPYRRPRTPRRRPPPPGRRMLRAAGELFAEQRVRRHRRRARSPGARGSRSTPSTPASAASRSCCSPCTTWCSAVARTGAGRAARLRPGHARGRGRAGQDRDVRRGARPAAPRHRPARRGAAGRGHDRPGLPGRAGGARRAPGRATCGCSPPTCAPPASCATDLTDDDVADLVWSMNSPEYYLLVTGRGRDPRGVRRAGWPTCGPGRCCGEDGSAGAAGAT